MKRYTFYFKQWTTDVPKDYFVLNRTSTKNNLTQYFCIVWLWKCVFYNIKCYILNQNIMEDFSVKLRAETKRSYDDLDISL